MRKILLGLLMFIVGCQSGNQSLNISGSWQDGFSTLQYLSGPCPGSLSGTTRLALLQNGAVVTGNAQFTFSGSTTTWIIQNGQMSSSTFSGELIPPVSGLANATFSFVLSSGALVGSINGANDAGCTYQISARLTKLP